MDEESQHHAVEAAEITLDLQPVIWTDNQWNRFLEILFGDLPDDVLQSDAALEQVEM